jgi:hypothetical protein
MRSLLTSILRIVDVHDFAAIDPQAAFAPRRVIHDS